MTDAGGIGLNRFEGFAGNDTITASNGSQSVLVGGDGNDTMTGADQTDELGGGAGADTMDGAGGIDIVTYYRANGSTDFTHGAFVNLSASSVTFDFNGVSDVTVLAGQAIDNWGDTDTLSNIEEVRGSNFDDVIVGNDGENYLVGRAGNDIIDGGGGNDFIFGGGDDTFVEDGDSDYLIGGDGADNFVFGTDIGETTIEDFIVGTDVLLFKSNISIDSLAEFDDDGDTINDSTLVTLSTGATVALLGVTGVGSASELIANVITGTTGSETLTGTAFNDTIIGGEGDDTLVGGGGVDTYVWSAGDGYDTISATGAANEDVIRINGTFYDYNWQPSGDDLLVGVAANDIYDWADVGGNLRIENFFSGGDSIAYMEADLGPANEFYPPYELSGPTRIYFSAVNGGDQGAYFESIIGTTGNDVMAGGGGSQDFVWGGDGNDTMSVSDGTQGIFRGGNGNDTMTGADQDDNLRGGAGNDIMNGGAGDGDQADYSRRSGSPVFTHGVFVNLSGASVTYDFNGTPGVTVLAGKAIDNWGDTDTLSNIESVRGSDFDDVIIGTSGANSLRGNAGDDIIVGGGNNGTDLDFIYGGGGSDTFVFGTELGETHIEDFVVGTDVLRFTGNVGIASLEEQDWEAPWGPTTVITLTTGATVVLVSVAGIADASELLAPAITGTTGSETLTGTAFNDTIIGGEGDDTLVGGGGVDTYVWSAGDGYDTISATGAANEDIIKINGTFYDYNWEIDGDDLVIGVAVDENYNWADVGGNLRLQGFLADADDSIAYMEVDLGVNNEWYSPGGGNARIYLNNTGSGGDQGNYQEAIFGTSGNDVMTGGGGALDNIFGFGGNDTISVSSGTSGNLIGGDGDDSITGGDQWDNLRGGAGDDTLNGGDGIDRVRYESQAGSPDPFLHGAFVNLSAASITFDFNGMPSVTVLAGKAIDNWGNTDTLSNIENVRGSNLDDVIVGTTGENVLQGLNGDDVISGSGGNDYLIGGGGSDSFVFNFVETGDTTIEDFIVGTDILSLNSGLSIESLLEIDSDDDTVVDSTLVTLDNGIIITLTDVLGVTDSNDLLA